LLPASSFAIAALIPYRGWAVIIVSITRLRLRKLRFLPRFAYHTLLSLFQAKGSPGVVAVRVARQKGLVFWTITLWRDENAMRHFRNSGSHRKIMPMLAHWCDETTYVRWAQESEKPPTLSQAYARLTSEGTVSKVLHPSSAHASRNFPSPQ
jgi:hypothetical protein